MFLSERLQLIAEFRAVCCCRHLVRGTSHCVRASLASCNGGGENARGVIRLRAGSQSREPDWLGGHDAAAAETLSLAHTFVSTTRTQWRFSWLSGAKTTS